ncbi:glycosyltransferase family 4 protein [Glutamicibacter ardleyensis]|uniref:Glycosyltransferase n=1 Tax=Glutamicibacter ardleyensis TaxID=225894 RepID=A0ABQ2DK75_9MICC|nr:glycosyltransferase family 4 protein [Glutamicibacter ardleyensis]GGJ60398.1 hypothetical protein GCM10007173_19000 [Glutamicibacter ardleyensis]
MKILNLLSKGITSFDESLEDFIISLERDGNLIETKDKDLLGDLSQSSELLDKAFSKERKLAWELYKSIDSTQYDFLVVPGISLSRALLGNASMHGKIITVITKNDEILLDKKVFSENYILHTITNSAAVIVDTKNSVHLKSMASETADRVFYPNELIAHKLINLQGRNAANYLSWRSSEHRMIIFSRSISDYKRVIVEDHNIACLPARLMPMLDNTAGHISISDSSNGENPNEIIYSEDEYAKSVRSSIYKLKKLVSEVDAQILVVESLPIANYCFQHFEMKRFSFLWINESNISEFRNLDEARKEIFFSLDKRLIVSNEMLRTELEMDNVSSIGKILVWPFVGSTDGPKFHPDVDFSRYGVVRAFNMVQGGSVPQMNDVHRTKLLLAGHDFKFSKQIINEIRSLGTVDIFEDEWTAQHVHDVARSREALRDKDVIWCEFASRNLVWYSKNKLPYQKLVVRMHGYEVRGPWIDGTLFENVDKWIFVSELLRDEAIEKFAIPFDKCLVIGNAVDSIDFDRPKYSDSRFNLGLVGIVPMIKRADRALDLLASLRSVDTRYTLHIKSRHPFEFQWLWDDIDLHDSYLSFYRRITSDPLLRGAVAFSEHGPDMGHWFRRVGWILSPSVRESFHLAPMEGMASGAIPLIWDRAGASEIFPRDNIFSSIEHISSYVHASNLSLDRFAELSSQAKTYASKYDVRNVTEMISEVLFG